MHETSIIEELLEVVRRTAEENGLVRVTGLLVRAGEMRAVVPELMREAFAVMSRGTVAEGAALEIELVPLKARCRACRRVVRVEQFAFFCPRCGRALSEVVTGKELDLVQVTGDKGDSP